MKPGTNFGKVAVLMGGKSAEREVSLKSGGMVLKALRSRGVDAHGFDPSERDFDSLRKERFERAFIALHGRFGEDGTVQGILEWLGIPYTGSGVLASALAMDKDKSKAVFAQAGLPLAHGRLMHRLEAAKAHPMPAPYVVKPNAQGSSVGVFIVREGANRPPEQLLDPDWTFGEEVLVEEFIDGKELTVSALSDGTRDQLYLALRLASLERYAEQSELLPFILDDILIHFDDERARAALAVLCELSATTQVLFFTHHARLIDLSRDLDPQRVRHHTLR